MSKDTYEAMKAYIDLAVLTGIEKLAVQLRASLPTETRSAEPVVGPAGKDGRDGIDGKDGAPGKDGERGADGIATVEQIEAIADQRVEKRMADVQVRTFADAYRGVFKPSESYKRGEFVTWDGSLHLALSDTQGKPGDGKDWQLVTKRGRDR